MFENLVTPMKMLKDEFPMLKDCTWIEADFSRICTDADLTRLLDPEVLEEAQRNEKRRYEALPYDMRMSASEKNFHDRAMEGITTNLIRDVLREKCDCVFGVSKLHGASGEWEIVCQ